MNVSDADVTKFRLVRLPCISRSDALLLTWFAVSLGSPGKLTSLKSAFYLGWESIDLTNEQRFQPPTLLCIKTSLILFYVRLFPSKKFRLAGWIIFGFTLFWACGAWLASLLECNPVSFFWDKSIKGGTCVPNPLITVGLTSGVVSCLNDILIFAMPIPVLAKLHMNAKKKIALMGVFALGILYAALPGSIVWGHANSDTQRYLHEFRAMDCPFGYRDRRHL